MPKEDLLARARTYKIKMQVVFVRATAYRSNEEQPIANAVGTLLADRAVGARRPCRQDTPMAAFVDLIAEAWACNDLSVLVDAIRYLGIKLGSHIACVRAEAWQVDPARPVLPLKSIF